MVGTEAVPAVMSITSEPANRVICHNCSDNTIRGLRHTSAGTSRFSRGVARVPSMSISARPYDNAQRQLRELYQTVTREKIQSGLDDLGMANRHIDTTPQLLSVPGFPLVSRDAGAQDSCADIVYWHPQHSFEA